MSENEEIYNLTVSPPEPEKPKLWSPQGRRKLIPTTLYAIGFLLLGLVVASIGPTLLMLSEETNASVSDTSLLFPSRSLGYLLGSAVGGPLFDRFDGHKVLATSLFLCGLGTFLLPFVKVVWGLYPLVVAQGLAMGGLDTGGNVLLIWLWGSQVAPFMQALHFAFSFGALMSPLIVAAFTHGDDASGLKWTFWVMAACYLPLGIGLLMVPSPQNPDRVAQGQNEVDGEGYRVRTESSTNNTTNGGQGSGSKIGTRELMVVILAGALLGVYVGAEVSYGGFITTYGQKYADFDPLDAEYLTAAFWGGLALGRLTAIPMSIWIPPRKFLLLDIVGCTVFSALLLFGLKTKPILWGGSALFGYFMGPIFPGTINVTESFMTVSGKAAAVFVVGASIGEMMFPLVLGAIFRAGDSHLYWLMVFMVIASGGMITSYIILVKLGRKVREYHELELDHAEGVQLTTMGGAKVDFDGDEDALISAATGPIPGLDSDSSYDSDPLPAI